jgi:hypothetical protein
MLVSLFKNESTFWLSVGKRLPLVKYIIQSHQGFIIKPQNVRINLNDTPILTGKSACLYCKCIQYFTVTNEGYFPRRQVESLYIYLCAYICIQMNNSSLGFLQCWSSI